MNLNTHHSDSSINLHHPISSAFYVWLLGYDFPDTIAIFTLKEIHFVCTKKKASLLKTLVSVAMEAVQTPFFIHEKVKGDNGYALLDEILSETALNHRNKAVHNENYHPIVLGCILGESPRSKLLWKWSKKKKPDGYEIVHIDNGVSRLFRIRADADRKDQDEKSLMEGDEKSLMEVSSDKDCREELGEKTDSRACGIILQMQVLPKEIDEMLSMTVERKSQLKETVIPKPEETHLEKNLKDNALSNSGNCSLGSDENDDWVLVEADD
ncbi:hypothetical protein HHK36_006587 [Tetracentron sinense]|uniref:FACT complex subunit n=1 Tax=Tetracentron sinense TaxID=13715 RepID=A0A834ZHR8_TETSI|nr:hypothetical protein HHK36_006587 [Tetracentron sinense]